MGKVLKIIAIIAITAAIAVYAPTIAAAALHLVGLTAAAGSGIALAATAVTTAALGIAATAGLALLSGKPHTSTAPGRQPSRGQPYERDGLRWSFPPDPPMRSAAPVRDRWWRDPVFCPWETIAVRKIAGTCMVPVIPAEARWVVVDRCATLEAGDLCLFRPDDIADYLRVGGHDPRHSAGLVKRFVGIDPERRVMVYETTNPPNRMETGMDRVQHLYRVRSWHPTWWAASRARWRN